MESSREPTRPSATPARSSPGRRGHTSCTSGLQEVLMESRAKAFGHPIHPMLIVFPLGLLAMALIFDIIHFVTAQGYWSEISYWMIAAGVISGLIAAPFGL